MILQAVHDINYQNTGDIQSCFLEHFNVSKADGSEIEVRKFDIMTQYSEVDPRHPVIIGGGGMLIKDLHAESIRKIIMQRRAPVILWGIGVNNNFQKENDSIPSWIHKATLVGIRDMELARKDDIRFVPCVSCLHPAFDAKYEIKNEIVCFEGNKLNLPYPSQCCLDGRPMQEIIEFLASARIIITSSYHGMYWGALLKKQVIVIPNSESSKFYFFPIKLHHATIDNYPDFIEQYKLCPGEKIYPGLLAWTRNNNLSFASLVEKTLNIKLSLKHQYVK